MVPKEKRSSEQQVCDVRGSRAECTDWLGTIEEKTVIQFTTGNNQGAHNQMRNSDSIEAFDHLPRP